MRKKRHFSYLPEGIAGEGLHPGGWKFIQRLTFSSSTTYQNLEQFWDMTPQNLPKSNRIAHIYRASKLSLRTCTTRKITIIMHVYLYKCKQLTPLTNFQYAWSVCRTYVLRAHSRTRNNTASADCMQHTANRLDIGRFLTLTCISLIDTYCKATGTPGPLADDAALGGTNLVRASKEVSQHSLLN